MFMERCKRLRRPVSTPDFDDSNVDDFDRDSDEDTDDASETEVLKQEEEFIEKKEQLFLDKIATLQKQLQQVIDGTHPDYQRRLRKIESIHHERNMFNEVWRQSETERVKADCKAEEAAASAELQEKTLELKDGLVGEFEEKRRQVEQERNTVELTGDSMEVKPASTRKLRRRPNDPVQPLTQEKRRKASPSQLNLLLDEAEILEDLKFIQRGKFHVQPNRKEIQLPTVHSQVSQDNCKAPHPPISQLSAGDFDLELMDYPNAASVLYQDAKIEHNKLFYDKKWHHRGQGVCVESREHGRFSGTIDTIGAQEITIKKVSDGSKTRITLSTLQRGRVILRRKS